MTHFDPNDFPIQEEPPRDYSPRKKYIRPGDMGIWICGTPMAAANARKPKTRLPHDMDDDPEYLKILEWARASGTIVPRIVSETFGLTDERLIDVMRQLYADGIKSQDDLDDEEYLRKHKDTCR